MSPIFSSFFPLSQDSQSSFFSVFPPPFPPLMTYNLRQQHTTVASFSPIPPAQCCFAGSKKYRKKSRHHCSNIERMEAGEGFLLRMSRDFWLGLYSLYMLGISMGLFQACHMIDMWLIVMSLEIISKEMGQNNIVPKFGKERKSHTS